MDSLQAGKLYTKYAHVRPHTERDALAHLLTEARFIPRADHVSGALHANRHKDIQHSRPRARMPLTIKIACHWHVKTDARSDRLHSLARRRCRFLHVHALTCTLCRPTAFRPQHRWRRARRKPSTSAEARISARRVRGYAAITEATQVSVRSFDVPYWVCCMRGICMHTHTHTHILYTFIHAHELELVHRVIMLDARICQSMLARASVHAFDAKWCAHNENTFARARSHRSRRRRRCCFVSNEGQRHTTACPRKPLKPAPNAIAIIQ